jgi:C-5 cytosine-specific DNA methylase
VHPPLLFLERSSTSLASRRPRNVHACCCSLLRLLSRRRPTFSADESMGKGKASGVPKGPTLTQLFRQLPVEGSGSHVLFADPAPDSLAWNEELDRCEDDDGSRMFESMDDSAMIEACVRCEGLQSDKTADPLDRKLSPADAMESHILEGSLLPPSQDSRDSMATAASTSSVPAAAASLPSSVASPPSIGGSPHSCGTVRLRPNPYLLNRSKMKRANSMPITHETDNENPEAKKPKTEALAVAAASDGTASGHVPGSSSAHEQNGSTEALIQSDRRGVGQPAVLDPRLASSGSSAAGAAPAAPIIVASSRSRCRVIGASPQKNLANLFEKSATELLSQTSVASQSRQSTVDQKFDICYKPRHETMRAREYRVGDTYICSIPRKNTAKHAKARTACDKRVVTILGFIKGKSRAVVEVRLELQDTFLNSNFDPAANQTWMNRYGSAYLTEGKTLCLLLNRFKEKVESVPISSIQYSGIDQGDNRNFVYQYRSAQCTAVRERLLPRKPVALELFAGAGGMSLGVKDAGFDVKYLVEMNFHVAHTLERNFDRLHLSYEMYNEDVLDFLDNIRNNAPRYPRVGDVDRIHASSPCQGFSRANR